jgi:hypothetical protein
LVSVLVPTSLADPVVELPDVPPVEPASGDVEPEVLPVDPVVAERSLSSAELLDVRGELSFAFELVESVELASLFFSSLFFSSLFFSSVIDESVADVPVSVAVDPVMPVCELLPVPAVPVPAVPESEALDPLGLVSGVVPVGLVSLEVVLAESL